MGMTKRDVDITIEGTTNNIKGTTKVTKETTKVTRGIIIGVI